VISKRGLSERTFWLALGLALVVGVVLVVEIRSSSGDLAAALDIGLWNCSPFFVALGIVAVSRRQSRAIRFAAYGFSAGATGLVLYGHIMWAFDIGRTATGSSTSALMFIFLPAWAVIVGAVAAVLAGIVGFALGPRA
jgi:hypothetical protein